MNDGLRPVDRVEVVTLIDNYAYLLLDSTKIVSRPPKAKGSGLWLLEKQKGRPFQAGLSRHNGIVRAA
jgi:hypothetical protein